MRWLVVLAVLVAPFAGAQEYCPHTGGQCSSEPVCDPATNPDILFCEDWEDGNHDGWDWNSAWDPRAQIVGTGGFQSDNALKITILEDLPNVPYPGATTSTPGIDTPIYLRWYTKFDTDYIFMSGYSDGQKHLYYRTGLSSNSCGQTYCGNMKTFIQAEGTCTGSATETDYDCTARKTAHWVLSLPGHSRVYLHNGTAERIVNSDVWYCMETYVKYNTAAGVADGEYILWVDGVKYMHHTNLEPYDDPTGVSYSQLPWLSSHYGGNPGPPHPQQDLWYDQLVASTSRILCMDESQPNPPPIEASIFYGVQADGVSTE